MNEIDKARLEVMGEIIDFVGDMDDEDFYQGNVVDMLKDHKEEMLKEINAREVSPFEWVVKEIKFPKETTVSIRCFVDGELVAFGCHRLNGVAKCCIQLDGSANLYQFDTLDEAKAWVEAKLGDGGK